MDKNTFGTFEYISSNNSGMDTDEFLVVQDDGTILLNRQVQYVSQAEDTKDALVNSQTCAVYDVNAQQFFVDVAANSCELISVADNYILPSTLAAPDETNNLYNNSFLLQVVSNENSAQSDKNLAIEEKSPREETHVNTITKKGNSCTEITLTDEQYKSLEQKGCVLLEENNKLFILDAYGLHEVTTNSELIPGVKSSPLPENTKRNDYEVPLFKIENIISEADINKSIALPIKHELEEPKLTTEQEEHSEIAGEELISDSAKCNIKIENAIQEQVVKNVRGKTLKIKTKHYYKDVPDRIVLGKTVNGKKLVAKVVKRTPPKVDAESCSQAKSKKHLLEASKPAVPLQVGKESLKSDEEFNSLIQQVLNRAPEAGGGVDAGAVAAARDVVGQLFHVPAIQASVAGRNVVITKGMQKSKKKNTNIVTGIVTANEDGSCCFTHVPDLLQTLMTEYIEQKNRSNTEVDTKLPDFTVLHVNISESKYENNVETISVVLNERVLSCEALTKKPQVNKLLACSSCADIFHSQLELEEHQEIHALEAEDTLTIDTDKLPPVINSMIPMRMDQGRKGVVFSCYQCPMKFNKLLNYTKHIETHGVSQQKSGKSDRKQPLYRCKMCNCSYFYPSTLAKHISSVHIKNKVVLYKRENTNK